MMLAERQLKELGRRTELGAELDWTRAACRAECVDGRATADVFFSDEPADIVLAKALCHECPLRDACLAGAQERHEPCGVWGGELFANGRVLAFKRKRGRPPKHNAELQPQSA